MVREERERHYQSDLPDPVMAVTYFLLLSCLGLAITAQAQDCSRPVPGPNMDLSDKDILLQTFPDGTKVSFACNVGYTSAGGPSVITCTAGRWSPVRLTCEKKNCGSLGEMDNGIIDHPKGTEFGAKAVITCKPGYILLGKREIVCGDHGWNGRLPVCEEVVCDPPPAVVNGAFSPEKDSYVYGEVIQYSCQNDFILNGSKSRSCSGDGTFMPESPKCIRKNCGFAGVVENGSIDYSGGTEFGDKIVVTCDTGYVLFGKREIICGDHGWNDSLPVCEVVVCDPPPVVVDGTFSPKKDFYVYGEVIQYRCQNDFTLNGSKSRSCTDSGTFEPDPPTCVMVHCQDPDIENADWIQGSRPPHGYKATVTFQCRTGYKMIGERTQTCEINNQWSPGLPGCEKYYLSY